MFKLHPRLEADTILLGHFELSRCLLMNDARYPWCILVPERDGISEIYQLSDKEQQQLQRESSLLSQCLMALFKADKMNIAALGNLVPQLHLHHVARYRSDESWPGPVWGVGVARLYTEAEQTERMQRIAQALPELQLPD